MKVTFMGTPDFAVPTLQSIIAEGHEVLAVYSQPPRAAGRGHKVRKTPVHLAADKHGIPVRTPATLKSKSEQTAFADLAADCAIVVAYGLILPQEVLQAVRLGCFNLHASLLPRWRGAAPIQRAIMAGDAESGVSVMRMEPGLDTGPICLSERVPITAGMTAGELHERLAALGAPLVCEALDMLSSNTLKCNPQSSDGVTYAGKIEKWEAQIDFNQPARDVLDKIHGLSPFPGAWFETDSDGEPLRVKLLKAELIEAGGLPGEVLDDQLTIACGSGAIRPRKLQRAGKGTMPLDEFMRGFEIRAGARLRGV